MTVPGYMRLIIIAVLAALLLSATAGCSGPPPPIGYFSTINFHQPVTGPGISASGDRYVLNANVLKHYSAGFELLSESVLNASRPEQYQYANPHTITSDGAGNIYLLIDKQELCKLGGGGGFDWSVEYTKVNSIEPMGDHIYVRHESSSEGRILSRLNTDGTEEWRIRDYSSAIHVDGVGFFFNVGQDLEFYGEDGEFKWALPAHELGSGAAVAGEPGLVLLVATTENGDGTHNLSVAGLNESGDKLWTTAVPNTPAWCLSCKIAGDNIHCISSDSGPFAGNPVDKTYQLTILDKSGDIIDIKQDIDWQILDEYDDSRILCLKAFEEEDYPDKLQYELQMRNATTAELIWSYTLPRELDGVATQDYQTVNRYTHSTPRILHNGNISFEKNSTLYELNAEGEVVSALQSTIITTYDTRPSTY